MVGTSPVPHLGTCWVSSPKEPQQHTGGALEVHCHAELRKPRQPSLPAWAGERKSGWCSRGTLSTKAQPSSWFQRGQGQLAWHPGTGCSLWLSENKEDSGETVRVFWLP